MNCVAVRDRLTERSLGTLAGRDGTDLERHLQWCAACRKEAGELDRAAATLAFSAAPADPDPALEQRVVSAVQRQAGSSAHARPGPRRGHVLVAIVAAAAVSLSGLGFGAVMARRAAHSEQQALDATIRQQSATEKFSRLLSTLPFTNPDGEVFLGTLAPQGGESGGGAAFTLVSPSIIDMAVVTVSGLPHPAAPAMPYVVQLAGPAKPVLTIGRIHQLDTGGAATISREFNRDLTGFVRVVVRDRAGHTVLAGRLARRADIASPSP